VVRERVSLRPRVWHGRSSGIEEFVRIRDVAFEATTKADQVKPYRPRTASRSCPELACIVSPMVKWTGFVVAAVVIAACSPVTTTSGTGVPDTAVPQTTSTADVHPTTSRAGTEDFCLSGDLSFVDSGLAAAVGEDVGDAAQIEEIRLDQAGTCERVTIAFTNGSGAPATSIGPTGITVLDFAGVVRIVTAPEITTTAIADTLLEGGLVYSATVVRDEAGSLAIDIRGTEGTPLLARAFTTPSPAALVIDIATSGDLSEPAGTSASAPAVVVAPGPGPNLYPLAVEGYAAPGLHSIRVQLGTEDSTDVDLAVALDGDIDAWQAFRVSIVDGPSGAAILFVGTADSNDQPLDGAVVSLDLP